MINSKTFDVNLFEKIFDLNSKNKIGANTIAVFTFILYKCEDLRKEMYYQIIKWHENLVSPDKRSSRRKISLNF
jgi:hypothetical protein